MDDIELLHVIGDAPEGPWSIFSVRLGDRSAMVSVVIPRSLWVQVTRQDPFSAEITLMEKIGRDAIAKRRDRGDLQGTVVVEAGDIPSAWPDPAEPWPVTLRRCGACGQMVPAGEVLEGLANALPPDSRGEVEVSVLCPTCMLSTVHHLTPWGISR